MTEGTDLQDDSQYIVDQLRRRMDSADQQREQAISKQSEAYEKAIEIEREHRDHSLSVLEHLLGQKVEAGDDELLVRIESIKEAQAKLASERDRAAEALRSANQKAIEQADIERAKSADRLAEQLGDRIGAVGDKTDAVQTSLKERISEGDQHLRQHIDQQVVQIEGALDAARRETSIIHEASERAIQKAESAAEKRFEGVNKFREQLSDQAKDFMPRELADAQLAELRKQISDLQRVESKTEGRSAGSDKTLGYLVAASTLVLGIVVVIVNVLIS